MTLVTGKPLLSFFVLAYGLSWAYWIPLALAGIRTLAAALSHGFYNMTSATAGSRGVIAAVATTCVMVWATVLLVQEGRRRGRPSSLLMEGTSRRTGSIAAPRHA